MSLGWSKVDDALFAAIAGRNGARYQLIAEQLPNTDGWDWTVWRLGDAPAAARHGNAPSVQAATKAAEAAPWRLLAPGGCRHRSGSWMRREVLPPLRQRCYRLCPMRPGHAQDNCRHVESHLPAVGIFPGDWWTTQHIHALVAAEHREDSQPTDETTDTDPLMR